MSSKNYNKARRRVRGKKGFYYHLAVYIAMGIFLFSINMLTTPWNPWFQFPLLAWGLALFFHYLAAVGIPFFNLDKNWEEKEIDREIRRIENRSPNQTLPSLQRPEIEEELELKEFKKLRRDWDDQEFV